MIFEMDTPQSEVVGQQHLQNEAGWYKLYMQPVLRFGVALLVLFLLLLAPSGDWGWQAAWFILMAPIPLAVVPGLYYIQRYHPDLIQERQRFFRNQGTAWFEKYIVPPLLALILVKYFAAGLQHQQSNSSTNTPFLSTPAQQAAAVGLVLSYILQTWTHCVNKYFSSVVRIQSDRDHKVCSSGPYAYIRHPGYVGYCLLSVSEAVLLESSWAMAVTVLLVCVFVLRTVFEDAFLQANLPGYAAFAQRVKYRFIPLLW
jgi:protein-S-isoprenylcysteine O-methyltransferase Ste14